MNLLHIDCSPRPDAHSRQLSSALVARLRSNHPTATITRRDLGLHPLPHAQPEYAAALSTPSAMAEGLNNGAMVLSEQLVNEIENADAVVIGTPMNNFTVPSVLKAWIDQILRMGRTIGTTESGAKVGLLQDKPVYIAVASGGIFSGDRANQPDFLTPYLTAALGCVGLHSIKFFALQATAFLSQEQLEANREGLLDSLDVELSQPVQRSLTRSGSLELRSNRSISAFPI